MEGALPSPAFRIRQGQSCLVAFWSGSSLHSVVGTFHVVYDDGTEDDFNVIRTASSGGKSMVVAPTKRIARKDGYVTSMFVGVGRATSAIPRGMCFCAAYIVQDPNLLDGGDVNGIVSTLAQGYLWTAHGLILGQYNEAGPAGGPGFMRTLSLGDPAANAEYGDQAVPSGTMWAVRGFSGTLVTDVNAANRIFSILLFDASQVVGVLGRAAYPVTASSTWLHQGGVSTQVSSSAGLSPCPINFSPATNLSVVYGIATATGVSVRFTTTSLQVGDNWGAGFLWVEEWVMPS